MTNNENMEKRLSQKSKFILMRYFEYTIIPTIVLNTRNIANALKNSFSDEPIKQAKFGATEKMSGSLAFAPEKVVEAASWIVLFLSFIFTACFTLTLLHIHIDSGNKLEFNEYRKRVDSETVLFAFLLILLSIQYNKMR